MDKWILYFCCLLLLWGCSETASSSSQGELTVIEQEIQLLKDRLHRIQIEEMKEEVEAQELMIADWDAYAKELEFIRKLEEEEKQIQFKIQELQERKANLIKSHSSN